MSQLTDGPALGLGYYGLVIRRQWLAIVGGVVFGALAAATYLVVTPAAATATADVSINIISTDPFNATKQASSLLDGTTESQIATSYSVASAAAQELGTGATAAEVRRNISVDAVTGASIVHIAFTAPTAAEARAGADAIAKSYLSYRTTQAQSKLDSILKSAEARRTQLGAELADANARISSSAQGSAAADQAKSDRDLITIELNALLTQKSVLAQIDTAGGSVLTEASQNDVVVNPSASKALGAGILVGGVIGLIAAFVINPRDRRLRTSADIIRATGAPVLADIRDVNASIPESGATLELLREARERILTELPADARVIAVFDDSPGPLPSDIPINLAIVMARSDVAIHLILPHAHPDQISELRAQLDLIELSSDASGSSFRAGVAPDLSVFVPAGVSETGDSEPDLSLLVRARATSHRDGELHLLVLGQSAARSSILAALRHSDAALFIAGLGRSRSDKVADIVAECRRLGLLFLGTVALPHARALPPVPADPDVHTGDAPTGSRADSSHQLSPVSK